MKILIVSLFLPQQKASHAGGRYVFETLSELAKRHDVSLATRVAEDEFASLDSLRPFCREIFPYSYPVSDRAAMDLLKLLMNYIGFSRYANRLMHHGSYDLVQVEWVEAGILITKGNTPMVLGAHDVITKPASRQFSQATGLKKIVKFFSFWLIKHLELMIARRYQVIFTHSDFDRDYLLGLDNSLQVETRPHPAGLDITEKTYQRRRNTILFLASYKYRQLNVDAALWFYREVLPQVRKEVPDAQFIIAGYGPPENLTSLADHDHNVSVPGFVDDIDKCYKEAAVFVAPILTGGGIIVKVLDALAAETPVVSTTYGNEGVGAVAGRDLLLADSPAEFAAAVIKLLSNPEYAATVAASGRRFVVSRYGREAAINKLEATYERLCSERTCLRKP